MADYTDVVRRVQALASEHIHVAVAGSIEELPVFHISSLLGRATSAPKLLLTAGVHGDEPAGVEALLRLMESDDGELLQPFDATVVPCVNPSGYVRNTRENGDGVDVNRAFEDDDVAEVRILKEILRGQQQDGAVDFHEDWEAKGFYMYEACRGGAMVGREVIEAVETIAAIDPDSDADVEVETQLSRGVFGVTESWGTKGLAPYVLKFHASHTLIFETPTSWPMDMRVAVHHRALRAALTGLTRYPPAAEGPKEKEE